MSLPSKSAHDIVRAEGALARALLPRVSGGEGGRRPDEGANPRKGEVSRPGLLAEIGRFGRFSILGFSLLLPLAGAATVAPDVPAGKVAALLLVAFAFHLFGYVSNDVFDLPLDRTEPLRAGSPLVRGLVSPRAAFAIAMVPVPLAAALHLAAGGAPSAAAALMLGMAFGLVYNAYGKRIAVPFVSDVVQALAWVALALYGALTMRAPLHAPLTMRAPLHAPLTMRAPLHAPLTMPAPLHAPLNGAFLPLAVTVFLYVLMINGLHGGLRDLANDARHGAKTTAILLGARASADGRVRVRPGLAVYGLTLHLLLLVAAELTFGWRWPLAALAIVASNAGLLTLARAALRATADHKAMVRAGFAHLFGSLGVVFLPYALFTHGIAAATMVAVYALPVAVLAVRMTRRRVFAAMRP